MSIIRRIDPLGLLCAICGSALWGLSFVIPVLMPGISALDVSLGRYLAYGVIGAGLMLARGPGRTRLTPGEWGHAFLFAVTGFYGCYTALVVAIDAAGPAPATLVMGLTPVCVALAGNYRRREVPFSRLTGPLLLIGLGLFAANLSRHGASLAGRNLELGLGASFAALFLLTHYLTANLVFLKDRPHISPLAWANAVGAALLAMATGALVLRLVLGAGWPWQGTQTTALGYIFGCLVLGFGVSWLGGFLWNQANTRLPAALAGQCVVFWPVSGLIYSYILERSWPGLVEAAGVGCVFAGVLWGVAAARPGPAGHGLGREGAV